MENCKYPYLVKTMGYKNCGECIFNCLKDNKKEMNKYEFAKEWEDKCRYGLASIENCRRCLFMTLCQFEHNQERLWKATHDPDNNS